MTRSLSLGRTCFMPPGSKACWINWGDREEKVEATISMPQSINVDGTRGYFVAISLRNRPRRLGLVSICKV